MSTTLPSSWHSGPDDSFHGKVEADGPFKPEKDRYHLIIGLFCPFAHRANLVFQMKKLQEYAGIDVSIVKPFPKGDDKGWPGWQFNVAGEEPYQGSTTDKLYGSRFLHEIYFKADPEYKGRYSVPVLFDKKLETIVNNESSELLRDLQTAFDPLLPTELQAISLYPDTLRKDIDRIAKWLQTDLNARVYQAGFATDQATYEQHVPVVFGALNAMEKIIAKHGGPYCLGEVMTELDIRLYASLIRFDPVYVQHFKCNLGEIRHVYPVLNNWLKNLYWNHALFKQTTDFRHIKENYTKSHQQVNPHAITPLGPWPDIEAGYQAEWSSLTLGEIDMPAVLAHESKLQ